jgi:hypothetical protein
MHRIPLLLVIVLSFPPAFASAASGRAAEIAQTVRQLRQIRTDDSDPLPASAIPLLTQLKPQLRDLIHETINAPDARMKTPNQLQSDVKAKLKMAGVSVGISQENGTGYVYGDIPDIRIERPAGHHNLLAVITTIGICCGEDSSLYLFRRSDEQWKLILADESSDYKEVSGAQGRFRYVISAPDWQGDFFVVTANVNSWCTSNWQSIRYKVVRPGLRSDQPEVILSARESIYLGMSDPVYKIELRGNTFTLSFNTSASDQEMDEGCVSHKLSLKYLVDGNRAKKLAAITSRPKI